MYYFFVDDVMLPVPPPKMDLKFINKNKTINLINEGEINIIKTQGLSEMSFEVMLPNQYYPFAVYETTTSMSLFDRLTGSTPSFKKADYFLDVFKRLKTSNEAFRLIITRMSQNFEFLFDTNFLVTLEDYSINEDANNGFDVQVPLNFKQYKPYATKEVEVSTDENGKKTGKLKTTRETSQKIPRAYEVKRDMSIWEACKRASGGNLDWQAIGNMNGVLTPDNVQKGTILTFVE